MDFKNPISKNKVNLHQGHRNRLRTSMIESQWDNFSDHQVLEFLLFYCFKRKDTNELAHKLINEFGTLTNVLEADYEDLLKVEGVGKTTASFLHSLPYVFKHYKQSKSIKKVDLSTPQKIFDYLGETISHMPKEELYVISVNNSSTLISSKKLSQGGKNEVSLTMADIVDYASKTHASGIILIHNHPDGNCEPSKEDIEITRNVYFSLYLSGVFLLDHLIVSSSNEFYSFQMSGKISEYKADVEKLYLSIGNK